MTQVELAEKREPQYNIGLTLWVHGGLRVHFRERGAAEGATPP